MTCLQKIHRLNNYGMVIFLYTVTSAVYRRKHQSKKHFHLIVIPQTNALFYLKCGFSEYKEASYQYDSFLNTVCPSDTSTNYFRDIAFERKYLVIAYWSSFSNENYYIHKLPRTVQTVKQKSA